MHALRNHYRYRKVLCHFISFIRRRFLSSTLARLKVKTTPDSIALVQRGVVRLDPMVSHVMPLDELKAAITMVGSYSDEHVKIIMEHR